MIQKTLFFIIRSLFRKKADHLFYFSRNIFIYLGISISSLAFFQNDSHNFKVLTVWPSDKNSCCTMLVIEETLSKTFKFNGTWCAFFDIGSSGSFYWDHWALVSTSQRYAYVPSPIMTLLSKFGWSLTSFNCSWAMPMRRFVWLTFSNFGTNFAATCFMSKTSEKFHDMSQPICRYPQKTL